MFESENLYLTYFNKHILLTEIFTAPYFNRTELCGEQFEIVKNFHSRVPTFILRKLRELNQK